MTTLSAETLRLRCKDARSIAARLGIEDPPPGSEAWQTWQVAVAAADRLEKQLMESRLPMDRHGVH